MTAVRRLHDAPPDRTPTRDECIAAAGEVYGAILADPERRAELLRHREAKLSQPATADGAPA